MGFFEDFFGIFLDFFLDFFGIFLGFFLGFFWKFWGIFGDFFGNSLEIWKDLICLSRFWFLSRFCLNGEGRRKDKNLDP